LHAVDSSKFLCSKEAVGGSADNKNNVIEMEKEKMKDLVYVVISAYDKMGVGYSSSHMLSRSELSAFLDKMKRNCWQNVSVSFA